MNVVLGAGLDSSAYRHPAARTFEVDRPATGDTRPRAATALFVPADLVTDPLGDRLAAHGWEPAAPAFVAWLGVTMHLDPDAVGATQQVGAFSADRGEPWRSAFAPDELAAVRTRTGFQVRDQADQRRALPAGWWRRTDALRPTRLTMLAHAAVP